MSKRRRLWPYLTAVLIGLPVLYVLSCGAVYWLDSRNLLPPLVQGWARDFIRPLLLFMAHGPDWLRNLVWAYLNFWG